MRVVIEGTEPPGRTFAGPHPYRDVQVGLQRRRTRWAAAAAAGDGIVDDGHGNVVEQLHRADDPAIVLSCDVEVVDRDEGVDFRGPHVQGARGDRFLYLSWIAGDPIHGTTMFRRAKLMLDRIDQRTVAAARSSGTLHATIRLTGADGGPVCAAVKPDAITWSSR